MLKNRKKFAQKVNPGFKILIQDNLFAQNLCFFTIFHQLRKITKKISRIILDNPENKKNNPDLL